MASRKLVFSNRTNRFRAIIRRVPLFRGARSSERRRKGWRGRLVIRYDDGCSKGCLARWRERNGPKGFPGWPIVRELGIPTTNHRGPSGHVVVGRIGSSLGARFRCVILTFVLYRSLDEDRWLSRDFRAPCWLPFGASFKYPVRSVSAVKKGVNYSRR